MTFIPSRSMHPDPAPARTRLAPGPLLVSLFLLAACGVTGAYFKDPRDSDRFQQQLRTRLGRIATAWSEDQKNGYVLFMHDLVARHPTPLYPEDVDLLLTTFRLPSASNASEVSEDWVDLTKEASRRSLTVFLAKLGRSADERVRVEQQVARLIAYTFEASREANPWMPRELEEEVREKIAAYLRAAAEDPFNALGMQPLTDEELDGVRAKIEERTESFRQSRANEEEKWRTRPDRPQSLHFFHAFHPELPYRELLSARSLPEAERRNVEARCQPFVDNATVGYFATPTVAFATLNAPRPTPREKRLNKKDFLRQVDRMEQEIIADDYARHVAWMAEEVWYVAEHPEALREYPELRGKIMEALREKRLVALQFLDYPVLIDLLPECLQLLRDRVAALQLADVCPDGARVLEVRLQEARETGETPETHEAKAPPENEEDPARQPPPVAPDRREARTSEEPAPQPTQPFPAWLAVVGGTMAGGILLLAVRRRKRRPQTP